MRGLRRRVLERYVTKTIYRSRYGAGGQLRKELTLPNNYMEMVQRATKPGLQNEIVTHSYAEELCTRVRNARNNTNHNFIDRMDACALAGDRFHPIVLSPHGGWWRWGNRDEHNDFICNVNHSGDSAPDYDIEAARFDNHARTWASWTHTAYMRQAVACAIAVASYGGARYAAKEEIRAARRGNGSEAADDGSGVGELLPEPAVAA